MIQYHESLLSKRIYYSKILYLNTIIMALALFYIFASTTTTLADAQNATNSTEIDTLLETAKNLYNQQKHDEAIQYLDKALQVDPNNTHALGNKGGALSSLGKYDEAIPYFDKALQIDPNATGALSNKGAVVWTH